MSSEAAAHEYARRGWRVIPLHHVDQAGACSCRRGARCSDSGKHPVGTRWQDRASTSGADVHTWWEERPEAGVGIVTGATSGLFVLDVDPAAGGSDTLVRLEHEHGPLPYTRTVRTGSRGRHLYWRWPGFDVRNSASALGPGLDVRGSGGMVVAPPSRSAKGPYALAVDAPVTAAPEWLLAMLRPPERPQHAAGNGAVPVSPEVAGHYAARALEAEVTAVRVAGRGTQNTSLNKAAFDLGQLIAVGALDENVVRRELVDASTASGYPARDGEAAMHNTIDSGLAGGKRTPRAPWPPVGHNPALTDTEAAALAAFETLVWAIYPRDADATIRADLLVGAPAAAHDPVFVADLLGDSAVLAGPALNGSGSAPGTTPEPPGTCDDTPERSSWEPVDLTSVLDGTAVPEEPTLLARTDGRCLLYPARVHWLQGEPESGKSWVMQHAASRVLADGGTVLYLDHESTPDAVVGRLLALGAERGAIRERLVYVQPEVGAMKAPSAYAALLGRRAALVVIDGVTDAVGIDGGSVLDNDEVAAWMRRVPRALARRTGAAVVCVDHVTKSAGGGGRFAIGAQSKLAGVDGATYLVEPIRPLGRGMVGELVIRVGKDRPGAVRPHCGAWRTADRTQEAARLVVDSTDRRTVHVVLAAPAAAAGAAGAERTTAGYERRTGVMQAVSRVLEAHPDGLTTKQARQHTSRRDGFVTEALKVLQAERYVLSRPHSNGEGQHYPLWLSVRPYRESSDPLLVTEGEPAGEGA